MPGQGPENPATRRPLARPFAAPETRVDGMLPTRAAPFAAPGATVFRRTSEPAGVPTALFVEELERYLPPSVVESGSGAAIEAAPQVSASAELVDVAPLMEETAPAEDLAVAKEPRPVGEGRSDILAPADVIETAFDESTPDAPFTAESNDGASPPAEAATTSSTPGPVSAWPALDVIAERDAWPIESMFDEDDCSTVEPPDQPGFDHGSGETFAVVSTIHAEGLDELVASTEARDRAVSVLEQLEARLKSGDLVVAADTGTSAESVLASILAALLLDRD